MTTPFDTWFAEQSDAGLADIKFALIPGKGVSVEAVQNEVLAAEAALAKNYTRQAPKATSMLPEHVSNFIAAH